MVAVLGLPSPFWLVEAVEQAPVVEELDVGVVPALRDRGHREELDVGKFGRVPLAHGGVDRAVEVLGVDRLPLFGVWNLELALGGCSVVLRLPVASAQGARGLGGKADGGVTDPAPP